jgi:EmrB/QacA subfamily drug resistance transporter
MDQRIPTRLTGGWLTLTTMCLAVLVAQVDTAVVNLAARPIGHSFGAGVSALQWVVDSYNLAYAILLLTGGVLADLYGRRLIFMTGAAIFSASSLLCAFAPSVAVLIGGRALAGAGAAFLLPASLAIIRVVWHDPDERGRALGIWAACNGVALAIGPSLGGILVNAFGWRSIFIVVVPISVAALVLAAISVPESSDPQGRRFDVVAQILGAVALGGMALGAIQFHETPILAASALVAAAVAVPLFVRVEAKQGEAALIPLDIFKARALRAAIASATGMTFGMYGVLFLVPLAWQSTGRLTATQAGLALLPMALVFLLVSPFSGRLVQAFGFRRVIAVGLSIVACGILVIGFSAESTTIVAAEFGLALTGLGMGLVTGPIMGQAVGAVPAPRSGTASSIINVARMTGVTLGVAILGAVYAGAGGGAHGLRVAMLAAAVVQLVCTAAGWHLCSADGSEQT